MSCLCIWFWFQLRSKDKKLAVISFTYTGFRLKAERSHTWPSRLPCALWGRAELLPWAQRPSPHSSSGALTTWQTAHPQPQHAAGRVPSGRTEGKDTRTARAPEPTLYTWAAKADCSKFNKPKKLVVLHQCKSVADYTHARVI